MSINTVREQRRRDIARQEVEKMIHRYNFECGQPVTRKATPDEMKVVGQKTNAKDHKEFFYKNIDGFKF